MTAYDNNDDPDIGSIDAIMKMMKRIESKKMNMMAKH